MAKILVVDDDPDIREFLRDELQHAGYQVTAASGGADAIVLAVEERFDLVLFDMLMPGMDGVQTARVLRKVMPNLPLLGLTGYVGKGYMAQAMALGVTCLSKPVAIADLLREIREVLRLR